MRKKTGKSTYNRAVGVDFDIAALVVVLGQPKLSWLGKLSIVLDVDMNTDVVEFFDDVVDGKWCQFLKRLSLAI